MKNQLNLYLTKENYQTFRKKCLVHDVSVSEMVDWWMETCDLDYQYEQYLKNKLNQYEKES